MIAPSVVRQIQRLLAEGSHGHRKIARMTGVSRGTVGAIARGERRDYHTSDGNGGKEVDEPPGPAQRCPNCGGMVYMPCRLCRVRTLLANGRVARASIEADAPLRLELHGEQRARYEQVRFGRLRKAAPHREG